jgi:hypothetical protein
MENRFALNASIGLLILVPAGLLALFLVHPKPSPVSFSRGVKGTIIMKQGCCVPEGIEIIGLTRRPPFSFDEPGNDSSDFVACASCLASYDGPVAHPDRDGRFVLKGVRHDEVFLHVRHPFYRPASNHAVPARPVADPSSEPETLVLEEGGVIEGVVRTHDSRPAVSAEVTLMEEYNPFSFFSARPGRITPFTTVTDERGCFRFEQVPSGPTLMLEARWPGYAPGQKSSLIARRGSVLPLRIELPPSSSLEGTVMYGPGVEVRLFRSDNYIKGVMYEEHERVLTDGNGRFRFQGLASGEYMIRLFEPAFVRSTIRGIQVGVGEHVTGLDLVMDPGGVLEGMVLDHETLPIAGAVVQARMTLNPSRWAEVVADDSRPITATADAQGRFELQGLDRCTYDLHVSAEDYAAERIRNVEAGQQDLRIVLRRGGTLSGNVVVGEKGKPVQAYTVHWIRRSDPVRSFREVFHMDRGASMEVSEKQGRFTLPNLAPGVYEFTFKAAGHGSRKLEGLKLDYEEVVDDLVIRLPGPSSLSGFVKDALTGDPVEGAMICQKSGLEGMIQGLVRDEVVVTDHRGAFRFDSLPAGKVRLVARHPGYLETALDGILLKEGRSLEGIEIILDRGAAICGSVLDRSRQPVPGAYIIVTNMIGSKVGSTRTDDRGFYEVRGLEKGPYAVTKMAEGTTSSEEGFMGRLLSDMVSQTVLVDTDQVVDCHFLLGAAGQGGVRVSGLVKGLEGALANALVTLCSADPEHRRLNPKTASSNSEGRYVFEGVAPGRYALRVMEGEGVATGNATEVVYEIDVSDTSHFRYDVMLPQGSISGKVVDGDTLEGLDRIRVVLRRVDAGRSADPLSKAMGHQVAEVYTDEEGVFRITRLHEGRYSLRAGGGNLFGMNSGGYGVRYIDAVEITGDEHVDGIRLVLEKGGDIRGRVTDPSGEPLSNAAVFVKALGQEELESHSECTTDGTGFYRYQGLNPGPCRVLVKHTDFAVRAGGIVVVEPNQVREMDVVLEKGVAVYIRPRGKGQVRLLRESAVEFLDTEGVNLFGLTSYVDVMEKFLGEADDGNGLYLGRYLPGHYKLNINHPRIGVLQLGVGIEKGQEEHVIFLEP